MALVKIVNWEDGSNARYDVNQMTPNGDGTYSTDGFTFDGEGRPLSAGVPGDGPGQWTNGLPGARGGSGPGGGGGGGGGGASGPLASFLKSQSAADLSSTKAAIQQALIAFGFVPENFNDPLGALDELTRGLMQKNTESGISGYARLLEGKKSGIKNLVNMLSATGMRRSGAKGFGLRQNQLGYDRNFADSLSELLGFTSSQYGGYANREAQRQMQILMGVGGGYGGGYGGGGGGGAGGGGGGGEPPNWWTPPEPTPPGGINNWDPAPGRPNYGGPPGGGWGGWEPS